MSGGDGPEATPSPGVPDGKLVPAHDQSHVVQQDSAGPVRAEGCNLAVRPQTPHAQGRAVSVKDDVVAIGQHGNHSSLVLGQLIDHLAGLDLEHLTTTEEVA